MSSGFGKFFTIHTWGESHGGGVGVVIDGCPPGLPMDEALIQIELDRRRPGQSDLVTPRNESDTCEILSGVFEGKTLGTPIGILVRNKDARSSAYEEMAVKYRPSHADYTYDRKYGRRAWAGGGRASARETIGRVAGGAVAAQVMRGDFPGIEVLAWVEAVQCVRAVVDPTKVRREVVESNAVRAPDERSAVEMRALIEATRSDGNSVGGIITCVVRNCPAGLGEPVFDKLEADLGKAMLSLPAVKGFEVGSGFEGTKLTGRDHNDAFYSDNGVVRTRTNCSGGIQGGITNGEDVVFRVAFKPTATIMTEQETVNDRGERTTLKGRGRHDACVLPRAVPIVEAMTWLVLCDQWLRQRGQCGGVAPFPLER